MLSFGISGQTWGALQIQDRSPQSRPVNQKRILMRPVLIVATGLGFATCPWSNTSQLNRNWKYRREFRPVCTVNNLFPVVDCQLHLHLLNDRRQVVGHHDDGLVHEVDSKAKVLLQHQTTSLAEHCVQMLSTTLPAYDKTTHTHTHTNTHTFTACIWPDHTHTLKSTSIKTITSTAVQYLFNHPSSLELPNLGQVLKRELPWMQVYYTSAALSVTQPTVSLQ